MAPVQSKQLCTSSKSYTKEKNYERTAKTKRKRIPPVKRLKVNSGENSPSQSSTPCSNGVAPPVLSNHQTIVQPRVSSRTAPRTTQTRKKKSTVFDNSEFDETTAEKYYIGDMDQVCRHCGALMFEVEREERGVDFRLCCSKGKVPIEYLQMRCPEGIKSLLADPAHEEYKHFHQFIRQYNTAMSFVSTGLNLIDGINNGECNWIFKIHGQVRHFIYNGDGGDDTPQHNQLYFYDPQEATALRNGTTQNKMLKPSILQYLDEELRHRNVFYLSHKRLYEVEKEMLENNNQEELQELCLVFRVTPNTDLRRWNAPTADEVSVIYKPGVTGDVKRDFAVYPRSATGIQKRVRIQQRSHYVEPMSYVLFYPEGSFGWGCGMEGLLNGIRKISQREFYAAKLFERRGEFNPIIHGKRLFQQYIVDMRMMVEQQKMDYIRQNQEKFLVESYGSLQDYLQQAADELGLGVGKTVICPSSVVGSERWYREQYQDAMAVVQKKGRPDLFITITCNPDWPEIKNNLKPGQSSVDRPDLVARVFKLRSQAILDDITKKHCLGKVKSYCYTVEFQKRGLPHIHLLVIFEDDCKLMEPRQIDQIITAELPDPITEPELYDFIKTHGVHGPCDVKPEMRVCRRKNVEVCEKKYPKQFQDVTEIGTEGYPFYKRRSGATTTIYSKGKAVTVDNSWVVPYNKMLTYKYQCHINVEACVSIKSVKYIYKYIYKGGDRADMIIKKTGAVTWDEVEHYLDGMYMTPPQAAWELFEGIKQFKSNVVKRLTVHLPNEFNVHFERGDEKKAYENASKKQTMLTAFFKLCQEDPFARTLLYEQVVEHYSFQPKTGVWTKLSDKNPYRKKYVARIYCVSPKDIERYYLRLLLFHVRGPTSYEAVRTVDGVEHPSFRLAAVALGLVAEDTEWFSCMEEAASYKMPKQLRSLFSYILNFNQPANALAIWDRFKANMSEDFVNAGYTENDALTMALLDLESYMIAVQATLTDFGFNIPNMPAPPNLTVEEIFAQDPEALVESLNVEQRIAFEAIKDAVMNEQARNRCFFIDGPGGSGKTYTYRALQEYLASKGKNVMPLATTGIAADLLKGGRTMHSGLELPRDVDDTTPVSMKWNSPGYNKLRETDLIIIDEASMLQAAQLGYISRLLKYVTNDERDFGGKVIVLGGDFRQTLPVIKGASPSKTLESVVKKSPLWSTFKILSLKHNMRAGSHGDFCDWLLNVGEGSLPYINEDYPGYVQIPDKYVCQPDNFIEKIYGEALVDCDPAKLADRIVVAPTNKQAWKLNDEAMARLSAPEKVYLSLDSADVDDSDVNIYTPEFLNSLNISGMPFHKLVLKPGAVIMLLRNLQIASGLQNGTRLLVLDLLPHLICAKILKGSNAGKIVFIPRIDCTTTDKRLPFQLRRRQFPVALSFAMTINKAQGQSFDRVGVFLPQTVFSHGQLYVALSRCKDPKSLFVKIEHEVPDESLQDSTLNIVWKSVLSRPFEVSPPEATPSFSRSYAAMEEDEPDDEMDIDDY